jgi:hypothetical protein
MTQPKRDAVFAPIAVAVCSAMMLWMPRSEPTPCNGPVQHLFWNCIRYSEAVAEAERAIDRALTPRKLRLVPLRERD